MNSLDVCCLIFYIFRDFPLVFLLLISYLIPLLFYNTLCDFNSFQLLKFGLWPRIWSILVNIRGALNKMYIFLLLSGLFMSIRSFWLTVLFLSSVSLLLFGLVI